MSGDGPALPCRGVKPPPALLTLAVSAPVPWPSGEGPPTPVGAVVPRSPRAVLTLGHPRHLGGRTVVPSPGSPTRLHCHCSAGGQDMGSGARGAVFQHQPACCSLHIGPRSPAGPQPGRGTPRAPMCQQTGPGACSAAGRGLRLEQPLEQGAHPRSRSRGRPPCGLAPLCRKETTQRSSGEGRRPCGQILGHLSTRRLREPLTNICEAGHHYLRKAPYESLPQRQQ